MTSPKCVNCKRALVLLRRKTRAGTHYWDHKNPTTLCLYPKPRSEDNPLGVTATVWTWITKEREDA